MIKPPAGYRPLAYSSPEAVQTTGSVAVVIGSKPGRNCAGCTAASISRTYFQACAQSCFQRQSAWRDRQFIRRADLLRHTFNEVVEDLKFGSRALMNFSSGSTRMINFGNRSCQHRISTQLRWVM